MESQILIRASVGPRVGTGHVMRTAALAEAYVRLGHQATMLCEQDLPSSLVGRIEGLGVSVERRAFDSRVDDAIQTRSLAEDLQADWIVLDGYDFDDEYQQMVKLSLAKLMVIDDFGHSTHRLADLILNQNIYAGQEQYELGAEKLLCGTPFLLLRSEFQNQNQPKPTPQKAKRILLTFGGADETNFTCKCLNALSEVKQPADLFVEIIVGACNSHHEQIKSLVKKLPFNSVVHRNINRMSSVLNRCDLAITAGGSTCYEITRCQVPAIVVSTAKNQVPVANSFEQHGCMLNLGNSETLSPFDLTQHIEKLISNPHKRTAMVEAGKALIDGQGTARVARRLLADQLSFRPASLGDAQRLFEWRNEESARAASFQSDRIQFSDHRNWLSRTLSDQWVDLWIVEAEDQAIGQVRFDYEPNADLATISVSLATEFRKRGLGTTMIEAACRNTFMEEDIEAIVALIKPENEASFKGFRNAGFVEAPAISIHGQTAKRLILSRPSSKNLPHRKSRLRKSA